MRRLLPRAGLVQRLANTLAFAAFLLILAFASGSASIASETIRIRPGFQQILERSGVSRLSVGNPEIVEAQPLPRDGGILVVGKRRGKPTLSCGKRVRGRCGTSKSDPERDRSSRMPGRSRAPFPA